MVKAYVARESGSELEAYEYEAGKLGADEVEVAVQFCGICHSDLAMIDNEWGNGQYPIVPGHEVVGEITEIGSNVDRLKVGQRVGIGWQCGSCMACEWCDSGDHNLCMHMQDTIVGHRGGFGDRIRSHWRFAIPVPESMDGEQVAPMMCGGITVYNPLVENNIKPGDRVGVVGIGGLGHFALQFAKAFGCHVTAFSGSAAKEGEARELGADTFVPNRDQHALRDVKRSCDFILVTAGASLPWDQYMEILRPRGRVCIVGVMTELVSVQVFNLIGGGRGIVGSPIGSPNRIRDMLSFSQANSIGAMTKRYPMEDVNHAIADLRAGKVHYRAVLENV
ncbi:NAD(P)-dependent alcohol dehydrogenase [Poriferisphaera sp. WC338]|uniref:NAD(P)-dependent alcohol dehydrogenase n=1 Tax=Poriferisphaera sp. WC338 TaxID=3425129 RepID=UPI003D817D2A